MKLGVSPTRHLTYCLNVHPGESWAENLAAIHSHTLAVKARVSPEAPLGLGLRLSSKAAAELAEPERLSAFRAFMAAHDLYSFTVNAFPYGRFHGTSVKERVYQPDWSRPERLRYTQQVAQLLAQLLPPDVDGSISTLPLGFAAASRRPGAAEAMLRNLAAMAVECARIEAHSGRTIRIGLEPEPGCLLETTEETRAFFSRQCYPQGSLIAAELAGCGRTTAERYLRRHIGVCFDTCHLALQYEDLPGSLARLAQAGIPVVKVQLSAALKTVPGRATSARLRDFTDPVYLHQVMARAVDGSVRARGDLEQALEGGRYEEDSEWRVHVHIPLYAHPGDGLTSTAAALDSRFFAALAQHGGTHIEIETYTFDVLPAALRQRGIVASIAEELQWVLAALR